MGAVQIGQMCFSVSSSTCVFLGGIFLGIFLDGMVNVALSAETCSEPVVRGEKGRWEELSRCVRIRTGEAGTEVKCQSNISCFNLGKGQVQGVGRVN